MAGFQPSHRAGPGRERVRRDSASGARRTGAPGTAARLVGTRVSWTAPATALLSFLLHLAFAAPGRAQETNESPLLVLAAASLTDVLPRVADAWVAQGGVEVQFSFAATSRLAPQVLAGHRADLFMAASEQWMDWVQERGGIRPESRRVVATNSLVVVVPSESSAHLRTLSDLEQPRFRRVALADENVPAGRYARAALHQAGTWDRLQGRIVRGGSVRGALEWAARGEVDAALVYATDPIGESRVRVALEIPTAGEVPRYLGAVVAGSDSERAALEFLDFLGGDSGAGILAEAGFGPAGGGGGLARPGGARQEADEVSYPDPWSAIRLSLVVALLATAVGLVPAVAGGWVLARKQFPGKGVLATALMAPLVLPPVVTGFLLLSLVGARSPLGQWLSGMGIHVPFTVLGAALAALVVGLPLYVMAIRGAFEAIDTRYEEVSWTLGVHRSDTFRRVSLPLALPGIAAGAVLAFARALGEFGATIVLAGNVEGSTRTIALAVYSLLESPSGRATTWWLVGASVAISLAALLGFEALNRRQRARLDDHRG